MSDIKKLLEGVEVEWKTLGEICDINTGQRPPVILDKPTNFDYINAGTSKSGYCKNSNCDGDTITTPSRGQGGIGYVGYQFDPFWLGPLCYKLKSTDQSILINKFLFYFLQSECQLILGLKKEGGVPAVNKCDLANILIPLPPLEIQKKIVHILDKFSTLTAELQGELQARKSQYEYYRHQLLTYPMEESDQLSRRSNRSATSIPNSDNPMQPPSASNPHTGNSVSQLRGKIEWKTLREIGTFIRGNGLQKKDFMRSGVPCIHYGQIYTHYGTFATQTKSFVSKETASKCKKAHKGDLIIASTSENVEDVGKTVAWLGDDDVAISNHTLIYSHNQNPKYLAYLFQTKAFLNYKKTKVIGVKVIDIPQKALEDFRIPIPSLEEQQRIVSILDKFDTLTTSIAEGLPKEIELRQKQYEYYRDMLLSFPKNNIKT